MNFDYESVNQNITADLGERALLLGNGHSIFYDQKFKYPSLFELSESELLKTLGAHLSTSNLETILSNLDISIELLSHLKVVESEAAKKKIKKIKSDFVSAIAKISVDRNVLAKSTDEAKKIYSKYNSIFCFNYDLVLYLIVNKNDQDFNDYFRAAGFSPEHKWLDRTDIFYPHGSLFIKNEEGLKKIVSDKEQFKNLNNTIKNYIKSGFFPYVILEGTKSKVTAIEKSPYSQFCYKNLKDKNYIEAIGLSFSESDKYLSDILIDKLLIDDTKMLIGFYTQEDKEQFETLFGNYIGKNVFLFESITHPIFGQKS